MWLPSDARQIGRYAIDACLQALRIRLFCTVNAMLPLLRPFFLTVLAAAFALQGAIDCAEARTAPAAIETVAAITCHDIDGMMASADTSEETRQRPAPAASHDCGQHCHLPAIAATAPGLADPVIRRAALAMPHLACRSGARIAPATPPPRRA